MTTGHVAWKLEHGRNRGFAQCLCEVVYKNNYFRFSGIACNIVREICEICLLNTAVQFTLIACNISIIFAQY